MRLVGFSTLAFLTACGTSGTINLASVSATATAAASSASGGLGTSGVAGSLGPSASTTGGVSATASNTAGGATTGTGSSAGGTSSGVVATASTGSTTGAFVIAAHAPFPQLNNSGGGVITSPALVTVTFAGESYDLPGFADWVVGSDWLQAVGRDYGVGLGTHLASYASDAGVGATLDDSAIQAFLSDNAGSALPTPTADTIYLLAFPSGTSITASAIGTSCTNFLGYHSSFSANGNRFVYAVVPTCAKAESANASFSWSVIASHEVLEAATDPGGGSWYLTGGVWSLLGSEDGDLCQGKYFQSDAGYLAQRMWSNTAAALGNTSPCVPFPASETYFNVTAEAQSGGNGDFSADVPSATAAQTVTFTLTPWSTAPDGFAFNLAQLQGPAVSIDIKTSNGRAPVLENGVPLDMIVTIPAGTASTDIDFVLLSSDDNFATQNIAPLKIHID